MDRDPPPAAPPTSDRDAFAREAEGRKRSVVFEFVAFLRENKKWWLAPVLIVLLVLGVLVVVGSGALGPLLYPLF